MDRLPHCLACIGIIAVAGGCPSDDGGVADSTTSGSTGQSSTTLTTTGTPTTTTSTPTTTTSQPTSDSSGSSDDSTTGDTTGTSSSSDSTGSSSSSSSSSSGGGLMGVPALEFMGGTVDLFDDDVAGFRFTIGVDDVLVSELGFFDVDTDGLTEAHDVGIYDVATETLQATATVPAGVVAPELQGFRYTPITPITLNAGEQYVIVAYRPTAADGILFDVANLTEAPWVTFDSNVAANGTGGLVFTNTPFLALNAWFGPMFLGEVVL